jgi:hypothetical protein
VSRYRRIRDVISEVQLGELLSAAAYYHLDLAMAPEFEPGLGPDFAYQRDRVLVSPDVEPGHPLLREFAAEDAPATRSAYAASAPVTDSTRPRLMKVSPRDGETVLDVVK